MAAALGGIATARVDSSQAMDTRSVPDRAPKIRVVIADDHAALRAPLAAYLELSGDIDIVAEASDGQEAIDFSRKHHPDVVMLDLNMPNVGGLEALPIIKAENPKGKALVLTGRNETPFIMRALRGAATGYVLKTATQE